MFNVTIDQTALTVSVDGYTKTEADALLVDKLDKVTTAEVVYATDNAGVQTTIPIADLGKVQDVTVNGTSVVNTTSKVAEIDITGKQNVLTAGANISIDSTNPAAPVINVTGLTTGTVTSVNGQNPDVSGIVTITAADITDVYSQTQVDTLLNGKISNISGTPVANNFVAVGADGTVVDSGSNASSFDTPTSVNTKVSNAAVASASFNPNANGNTVDVTLTKGDASTVTSSIAQATTTQAGLMSSTSYNLLQSVNTSVQSLSQGGLWRATYDTYDSANSSNVPPITSLLAANPGLVVANPAWTINDYVFVLKDESSNGGEFDAETSYIVYDDAGTLKLAFRKLESVPIVTATNSDLGVVVGDSAAGNVSITGGVMTVNGFSTVQSTANSAVQSVTINGGSDLKSGTGVNLTADTTVTASSSNLVTSGAVAAAKLANPHALTLQGNGTTTVGTYDGSSAVTLNIDSVVNALINNTDFISKIAASISAGNGINLTNPGGGNPLNLSVKVRTGAGDYIPIVSDANGLYIESPLATGVNL